MSEYEHKLDRVIKAIELLTDVVEKNTPVSGSVNSLDSAAALRQELNTVREMLPTTSIRTEDVDLWGVERPDV